MSPANRCGSHLTNRCSQPLATPVPCARISASSPVFVSAGNTRLGRVARSQPMMSHSCASRKPAAVGNWLDHLVRFSSFVYLYAGCGKVTSSVTSERTLRGRDGNLLEIHWPEDSEPRTGYTMAVLPRWASTAAAAGCTWRRTVRPAATGVCLLPGSGGIGGGGGLLTE